MSECLVRAPSFAKAPHSGSAPSSSFSALLDLEPQHFDGYFGVLVMLLFFVLCPVVAVAVQWHFVVAVTLVAKSVLMSLLLTAAIWSDVVVLMMVHVLFSCLHHHLSHFLLSR